MNRIEKVNQAVEFMEANLTGNIDLDRIAEAIHYSKFYLHRVFTRTVGITIHDYLQRRRLTEAAKLLVFSNKSILDIALLAGYESQQAFTGVFTAMYKQPPSQYREQEKFYPLQLRYEFEGGMNRPAKKGYSAWEIVFATENDIPCWMKLVRLVVDGFPYLQEDEYIRVLKQKIETRQALILKDGETAAGILLFSQKEGNIDFLGTHPLYRGKGIPQALLDKVMGELLTGRDISITTYRKGDRADTGQRKEIMEMGFAEAELLVEFGYPTQRFIRSVENKNGARA
ncbi:MAG: GNAT family N-acetyltransferase [Eubacteriales bacterium]|nr:GNAT family N-acetyltransferase [Eubacteriales bacterium]